MSTEEFREELSKINDKIEIIGDFAGANNRIKAQCKVCNHEWHVRPSSLRSGSGCPKCAGTLKIVSGFKSDSTASDKLNGVVVRVSKVEKLIMSINLRNIIQP